MKTSAVATKQEAAADRGRARWRMKRVGAVAALFFILYVGVVGALFAAQRVLLYPGAGRHPFASVTTAGLPGF
jgi:hypothetical protein